MLLGIFAMLAGLCLLILVHEFGHWAVARFFGFQTPVFSIGMPFPKYIVLGRRWNTEFRLTPLLIGGYVALPEMSDETTMKEYAKHFGADPSTLKHFPIWKRALVAVAGVTMNFLTALVLLFLLFALVGKPDPLITNSYIDSLSTSNTIARDAGFQPKDVFVSVDGQSVKTPDDVVKDITSHKGTPAVVVVQRNGQPVTITVTPDQDGHIGISIGANQVMRYQRVPVGTAALAAGNFTVQETVAIVKAVGYMTHLVPAPKNLPSGATDVHGIVAIVQVGADAFQQGFYMFVTILVAISLNLAVFNILPIPILDGGYLLFMAIEKVRGKPLDRALQQKIQSIFFFLLIALMVYGLMNDITKPIGR